MLPKLAPRFFLWNRIQADPDNSAGAFLSPDREVLRLCFGIASTASCGLLVSFFCAQVNARYNDFRHAVRRMEEAALSFGDTESECEEDEEGGVGRRKAAMRRWLAALEEIQARGGVPGPQAAARLAGDAASGAPSAAASGAMPAVQPVKAADGSGLGPPGPAEPTASLAGSREPAEGEDAARNSGPGDEPGTGTTTDESSSERDDKDKREGATGQDPKKTSESDEPAPTESSTPGPRDHLGLAAADADVSAPVATCSALLCIQLHFARRMQVAVRSLW